MLRVLALITVLVLTGAAQADGHLVTSITARGVAKVVSIDGQPSTEVGKARVVMTLRKGVFRLVASSPHVNCVLQATRTGRSRVLMIATQACGKGVVTGSLGFANAKQARGLYGQLRLTTADGKVIEEAWQLTY